MTLNEARAFVCVWLRRPENKEGKVTIWYAEQITDVCRMLAEAVAEARMPQPCCQEYATCQRSCTPRGRTVERERCARIAATLTVDGRLADGMWIADLIRKMTAPDEMAG